MNRCIITSVSYRGKEYTISALYDENRRMTELIPEPKDNTPILGNIYIGRVDNIVQNINAAFVRISDSQNCFLSLEDCKNPIFTDKKSSKKAIAVGDELLVQVTREAVKTKDPYVTTNLTLNGRYAVITTGNTKLSVSGKLSADNKARYKAFLSDNKERFSCSGQFVNENGYGIDFGWIIRTNSGSADEEVVALDMDMLKAKMEQLILLSRHKTCYSIIYKQEPFYLKYIDDLRADELEGIVTDEPAIFDKLCEKYGIPKEARESQGAVKTPVYEFDTGSGFKIKYHCDPAISLSSLYSVMTNLDEALNKKIWLKSGANLLIEQLETMTVIDVNTAKNISKKDPDQYLLRVNKEAAAEIARQLILRNISGMILVDFINMPSPEMDNELLSFIRKCLANDRIPCKLIDMTGLGLVEITRKKTRKPLSEIIVDLKRLV